MFHTQDGTVTFGWRKLLVDRESSNHTSLPKHAMRSSGHESLTRFTNGVASFSHSKLSPSVLIRNATDESTFCLPWTHTNKDKSPYQISNKPTLPLPGAQATLINTGKSDGALFSANKAVIDHPSQ